MAKMTVAMIIVVMIMLCILAKPFSWLFCFSYLQSQINLPGSPDLDPWQYVRE